MKRRMFLHPLWIHGPAAMLWFVGLGKLIANWPLPERAPVHFSTLGVADGWGNPTYMVATLLVMALGFIGLAAFLAELWARQEVTKRYSWLHLMDEAVLGLFVGMLWTYIPAAAAGQMEFFPFPWRSVLLFSVPAIAAAALLEALRPYRAVPVGSGGGHPETVGEMPTGADWLHVERQNPSWMNGLWIAASLGMLGMAFLLATDLGGFAALVGIAGAAPLTLLGGIQVTVTPKSVVVRWGAAGYRLFRADPAELEVVEARDFSPLADFGGWGIRYGRNRTWGFFLRGARGLFLQTRKGRRVLVGSDNASRLEAIIKKAKGVADGG